ncbi:hypothetical protein B0J14DRAFT_568691 [Halenospora varia]|nr:hypothetical protein B0J14DRAFT_568691 [Halenospora varia]
MTRDKSITNTKAQRAIQRENLRKVFDAGFADKPTPPVKSQHATGLNSSIPSTTSTRLRNGVETRGELGSPLKQSLLLSDVKDSLGSPNSGRANTTLTALPSAPRGRTRGLADAKRKHVRTADDDKLQDKPQEGSSDGYILEANGNTIRRKCPDDNGGKSKPLFDAMPEDIQQKADAAQLQNMREMTTITSDAASVPYPVLAAQANQSCQTTQALTPSPAPFGVQRENLPAQPRGQRSLSNLHENEVVQNVAQDLGKTIDDREREKRFEEERHVNMAADANREVQNAAQAPVLPVSQSGQGFKMPLPTPPTQPQIPGLALFNGQAQSIQLPQVPPHFVAAAPVIGNYQTQGTQPPQIHFHPVDAILSAVPVFGRMTQVLPWNSIGGHRISFNWTPSHACQFVKHVSTPAYKDNPNSNHDIYHCWSTPNFIPWCNTLLPEASKYGESIAEEARLSDHFLPYDTLWPFYVVQGDESTAYTLSPSPNNDLPGDLIGWLERIDLNPTEDMEVESNPQEEQCKADPTVFCFSLNVYQQVASTFTDLASVDVDMETPQQMPRAPLFGSSTPAPSAFEQMTAQSQPHQAPPCTPTFFQTKRSQEWEQQQQMFQGPYFPPHAYREWVQYQAMCRVAPLPMSLPPFRPYQKVVSSVLGSGPMEVNMTTQQQQMVHPPPVLPSFTAPNGFQQATPQQQKWQAPPANQAVVPSTPFQVVPAVSNPHPMDVELSPQQQMVQGGFNAAAFDAAGFSSAFSGSKNQTKPVESIYDQMQKNEKRLPKPRPAPAPKSVLVTPAKEQARQQPVPQVEESHKPPVVASPLPALPLTPIPEAASVVPDGEHFAEQMISQEKENSGAPLVAPPPPLPSPTPVMGAPATVSDVEAPVEETILQDEGSSEPVQAPSPSMSSPPSAAPEAAPVVLEVEASVEGLVPEEENTESAPVDSPLSLSSLAHNPRPSYSVPEVEPHDDSTDEGGDSDEEDHEYPSPFTSPSSSMHSSPASVLKASSSACEGESATDETKHQVEESPVRVVIYSPGPWAGLKRTRDGNELPNYDEPAHKMRRLNSFVATPEQAFFARDPSASPRAITSSHPARRSAARKAIDRRKMDAATAARIIQIGRISKRRLENSGMVKKNVEIDNHHRNLPVESKSHNWGTCGQIVSTLFSKIKGWAT